MSDLEELYTFVRARARGNIEPATDIYADYAPSYAKLPYAIIFWLGGGDRNRIKRHDPSLVLGIKGVASDQQQALMIDKRLRDLFDDFEDSYGSTYQGTSWHIVSSQCEQMLHMVDPVDGTFIFHEGHKYRFELEEKP
jgi:hypothetical protein